MKYYLDTEFDGHGGALLSLALVREDGQSLYQVYGHSASDAWVLENVIPVITAAPIRAHLVTPREGAFAIADFLEADPDPVIVSDWPADIRYFCDLIEFPGGVMAPIAGLKFEIRRVDAYPTTLTGAVQHNAWWDAMALRHKLEASA